MPAHDLGRAAREVFGNVPREQQSLFYALAFGALAVFAIGFLRRARRWTRGAPPPPRIPLREIPARLRLVLEHGLRQPRLVRAGAGSHRLLLVGFLGLFAGTLLVSLDHDTPLDFLHGPFYLAFSLAMDLCGVLLLAGVARAAHRRYRERPARQRPGSGFGPLLAALALLGASGFAVEGLRMALLGSFWLDASPVGAAVAGLVALAEPTAQGLAFGHRLAWWLHASLALAFVAVFPFTRMRHALAAPLSISTARLGRPGALSTPFRLADLERGAVARAAPEALSDLGWRERIGLDACTECGLCDAACPARAAGRPLSPRAVVTSLRDHLDRGGRDAWSTPLERIVSPEAAWSCTSCAACVAACPVAIDPVELVGATRRALVTRGRLEPSIAAMLRNLRRSGNPFGAPPAERLAWTRALPPGEQPPRLDQGAECDVLLWVGCMGAFDERGQAIARATASLLARAGVRFAILGADERCTGDPARRLGEEGLFQELARANLAVLESHGVRRIVTPCPHCRTALAGDYAGLGGRFEVSHHSELLAELVAGGRLRLDPARQAGALTFHDPCLLGRQAGIFDAPRDVLRALAGANLREMPRSREDGFCCGAGGGGAWFDLGLGRKPNAIRYAEAAGTGAATVATACMFCTSMLEESAGAGGGPAVRDVAELVREACLP